MAKRRQLTVEQRSAICTLRVEGYTRHRETNSNQDRKRSGRPKSTTIAEDNFIIVTSKRNRRLTAPAITAALNESRQTPVSTSTVKGRLLSAELRGCVAVKKPKLTARHKQNRLKWAKHHINWSIKKWNKVFWTDESKFEIYGSNRRVFVRRQKQERTIEVCMVPMVWGCFGNKRPDNDPKHSSKLRKTYLLEKKRDRTIEITDWPSQSPDFPPIELVWDELDRRVKSRSPTSAKQLWQYLEEE
ncbi:hypothetical protein ILUMI_07012 [Ignelater luminosus]|uniref:Transposase Tc1-like domain-containing protein n=1 Tax=Ignelater luminosus TaxID=2038154 RepID=A0A8K0GH84_IGNLU|nr:hypothetical protein ILUMI_07012 [Ignelater luminosus]